MTAPKTATTVTKKALEDAFAAERKKETMCPLGKIITEHEHGAVLADKVADTLTYSAATIARVMKNFGFPHVSTETINKHRKRTCRCEF